MIPLAYELKKLNHNVIFASGEEHLSLIRSELPDCSCIIFPGFNPGYSRYLAQYLSILFRLPQLVFHIIREHFRLKKIISDYSVDIVISDNRFGLWNRRIKSVYVTHMPRIPFPQPFRFLEPAGILLHRLIITKYDFCFIPDLPGENNISGKLSHGLRLPDNVRYIGLLSRFSNIVQIDKTASQPAYNTIILSGPRLQKEMLKKKLINIFREKEPATVILEGKPHLKKEQEKDGNITLYNHLPSGKMIKIITGSDGLICRSGYTSIMDLIALNSSALLIPTPGQTEQEYLAEYLSEKGMFSSLNQKNLNGNTLFPSKKPFDNSGLVRESTILLCRVLEELLDQPHHNPQS
jgi:UDP:flavonoid glycosyltransferase YjiC (YdhE family)